MRLGSCKPARSSLEMDNRGREWRLETNRSEYF